MRLGEGERGMVPADWLAGWDALLQLGRSRRGAYRFRTNQALLIDAMLAARRDSLDLDVDSAFATARAAVRSFDGVKPLQEAASFGTELRGYQRDGLGWLAFLARHDLGGCLADDMGLGKTAQVLALLDLRRASTDRAGPSLVVAPRSLVDHWCAEARRFAPRLTVLDHTGTGRRTALDAEPPFADVDLVVTTYGTLRADVEQLASVEFDHVILDEAQAIKNANSQTNKAARALCGRHRLALTGTPIENHLGELWALFEFLNPGMLGRANAFRKLLARRPGDDERDLVAALRVAM